MAQVRQINFFPSCIENSDGSDLWPNSEFSSYTVGLGLEDAMATYWKVKTWEIYFGNSETSSPVSGEIIEEESNGAESEKDLVCSLGGWKYNLAVPPYSGTEETIGCRINLFFNSRVVKFYEDFYYPVLNFSWFNNLFPITNIGIVDGEYLRFFCEINYPSPSTVKYRVEIFPETYWDYD